MSGDLSIKGPLRAAGDLETLEPLWRELHLHHLRVATYGPLVEDLDASWARRRLWYQRLLEDGGAFFVATNRDGRAVGYAFVQVSAGPDDTFETANGFVEVISLVVTADGRGQGTGARLIGEVESLAIGLGIDTLKVAVMAGNDAAGRFYEASGFALGELVLYKRLKRQLWARQSRL